MMPELTNQAPPLVSVPLHPIVGCCRVCGTDGVETRNLDLYVNGSEGLNACHDCEMAIVEYVRRLQSTAARARKWGYMAAKQVAAAKAANGRTEARGAEPRCLQ